MSDEMPKDFQYLVLFAALSGRKFKKSELGLEIKIKDLDRLVDETKLLDSEKKGASRELSANAGTVAWAAANLNLEMPGKAKAVLTIVHLIRAKTHAYLKAHGIALNEFLAPLSVEESLVAAVKKAYLALAGGNFGSRVLLKDLRPQIPMNRQEQDSAFLDLIRSGDADFFAEDDPNSRSREDDEAALVLGDRRRHLLYLRK